MNDVAVDLMVVPHQSGAAKATARAAKIPTHEKRTARIARGLEPALLDNKIDEIASFEESNFRSFQVRIAGPADLIVAKAIKINERIEQSALRPDRLQEIDALDVFRLLQAVDTHITEDNAAVVSAEVIDLYRKFASIPTGAFPILAASAAGNDPTIAPAFVALMKQLLDAKGNQI